MSHGCINRGVLSAMGGEKLCESPSLRFSKFLNVPSESQDKANEILRFVGYFNAAIKNLPPPSEFPLKNARQFALRLGGKLIVNQAGGVLENVGICLHRNFSYPYIPGSAVKGVSRHAAWEMWFAESDKAKKLELAQKIADVFGFPTGDRKPKKNASERDYLDNYLWENASGKYGTEDSPKSFAGTVAFLNAIPCHPKKIELDTDICTCHHPDYYKPKGSSHEIAWDDEDPKPQIFPVIQTGAGFCFRLVPLNTDADLDFAEAMLKNALTINGIGGKTAAGYGWFEEDTRLNNTLEKNKKAGSSPLGAKILAMKNPELADFLKQPELSVEAQEALKAVYDVLTTGQKNKIKDLFKKGKGAAYKNILAVWGEAESQKLFTK